MSLIVWVGLGFGALSPHRYRIDIFRQLQLGNKVYEPSKSIVVDLRVFFLRPPTVKTFHAKRVHSLACLKITKDRFVAIERISPGINLGAPGEAGQ